MTSYEQPPLLSLLPDEIASPLLHEQNEIEAHMIGQLKALAHPIRWRLVQILAETQGMLCVSELVALFPRTQATISLHLRRLYRAGLLDVRHVSLYAYYSVKSGVLTQFEQQFATIAQDAQRSSDSIQS